MPTILIDEPLLKRLGSLERETEFVDESGRRLGRFVPESQPVRPKPGTFDPPQEPDPSKRGAAMARLLQSWSDHPLSPDAPRLTREEMHERR